jgi:DNA-binding CsgD family transcriptional regulator/PAS domain-containing protein
VNEVDLSSLIYKAALTDDWQPIADALKLALDDLVSVQFHGRELEINEVTIDGQAGYEPAMLDSHGRYHLAVDPREPDSAGVPVAGILRSAFEAQRMLQGERLVNRGYLDLIDRLENCIFLLDARGRIEFRNKAASRLFCADKLFHVDSAGILRLGDARADEVLHAGMAAICRKELAVVPGSFPIRHSASAPHIAVLTPFATDRDQSGIFAGFIGDHVPVAVLAIDPRPSQPQSCHRMLSATFGLTQAETELALALTDGITLREYAAQRLVSLHTVRNQLKSVFEKTGVHRQAELVSVLGRIVG